MALGMDEVLGVGKLAVEAAVAGAGAFAGIKRYINGGIKRVEAGLNDHRDETRQAFVDLTVDVRTLSKTLSDVQLAEAYRKGRDSRAP